MINSSGDFSITHIKTGEEQTIIQKLIHESHKMMRVFINPLGKYREEHQYLWKNQSHLQSKWLLPH